MITILGIALSAAALLWSADFMSALYTRGQASAKAQKWIADAAQITVAARQSGSLSTDGDNWQQGSNTAPTAAALIPAYLSDLPQHNSAYVFQPCSIKEGKAQGHANCPAYSSGAAVLEAQVENITVCQEIQKITNRGSVDLPTVTITGFKNQTSYFGTVPALTVNSNQQFNCVAGDDDNYYFFYRVFLDR